MSKGSNSAPLMQILMVYRQKIGRLSMFAEIEHKCHTRQGALSNKEHVKGGPSSAQPDRIDVTHQHAIATVKLASGLLSTTSSTAILLTKS